MVDFVVDRGLDVLLAQINAAAPGRDKSSDGSVGDPDHQTRESAHNPEDSEDADAPGNPDDQVDARDFTHDPAHNADMGVVTEALRKSKDKRLRLVIFNGRQFSNYWKDGIPPYTWRPYTGSNQHTRHAHVEVNDVYHDVTTPWEIGIDMTVEETFNAVWRQDKIPNPYGDKATNPTIWAQTALTNIAADTNATRALVAALGTSGIDMDALAELVRRVVREELDATRLTGR